MPNGQENEPPRLFLPLQGKAGARRHKNLEGEQTGPPDGFDGRPRVPESGTPSEGSKTRPTSRTRWEYPRQGQEGREESPRREASSRWTLSNETSIPDHTSPALMTTPSGCSQPPQTWHRFSHGSRDRSSPKTMTLAPPGVRHAPSLEKVRPANKGRRLPSRTNAFRRKGRSGAVPPEKSSITLEGVQNSSKGSGATPAGVARTTPTETRPLEEALLEHKRSSRDSGLLPRMSIGGIPIDTHNGRIREQIETLTRRSDLNT